MALKILNPGTAPLGQFDGYDLDYLNVLGGEVATFVGVGLSAGFGFPDKSAYDQLDGYMASTTQLRPTVTTSQWTSTARPIFLTDDGTAGYGTLLGTLVGGVVGQISYGINSTVPASSLIGPHTAAGSGKITCWHQPGLYATTLDAVDPLQVTPTSGLTSGQALYALGANGRLTTTSGAKTLTQPVAYFVEFNTNGSLVTTPQSLVAALNSPSGSVSSLLSKKFAQVTYWFGGSAGVT
jgi:hypothetical protein